MAQQNKKIQKSVDGLSYLVPKEILESQAVELSSRTLKNLVKASSGEPKRPRSEAQLANDKRLGEEAKARFQARKEQQRQLKQAAKEANLEEAAKIAELDRKVEEAIVKPVRIAKKKEDEDSKIAAGTHIKVVLKARKPRKKVVEVPITDSDLTTDITETETETEDTDVEEYKSKARVARRAQVARKLVKTVEKIDRVIQQQPIAPANPYAAMLASRWR